jgi:hypothetical protein
MGYGIWEADMITDECMHLNLIQIVIAIYVYSNRLARLGHDSAQRSPSMCISGIARGPSAISDY